jgi:predicted transcriptional regulator of viral defense system
MSMKDLLRQRSTLTYDEISSHMDSEGSSNKRTRESLVAYHVRKGRLLRVRRGIFVVVPPGMDPDSFAVDPCLLAARMTDDAVLAYHTALEVFGRAHSVFEEFYFLTGKAFHGASFRSFRFRGVVFPKALRRKKREEYGLKIVDRSGVEVRVTTLERTLVDVLDRPDLCGGWEEAWRSLQSVEYFDLDVVTEYARLLGNATTAAKVGFFLEQHRERLMVEDCHLDALKKYRPRSPHYMERRSRSGGRMMAQWNLIVPEWLVERVWEEPA